LNSSSIAYPDLRLVLTTTAKRKTLFACGMAGFNEQRTFTGAQVAFLQSQDSNLRVERARKILNREANISKTISVTLLL